MVLGLGRRERLRRDSSTEVPLAVLHEAMLKVFAREAEEQRTDTLRSLSSQIWGTPSGVFLFFCPMYDHVMVMFDNDPTTMVWIELTPAILEDLEQQVLPKLAAHAEASYRYQARRRHALIGLDLRIARKVASGVLDDESEEPESGERSTDEELATAHAAAEQAIRAFVERYKPAAETESPQD